MTRLHRPLTLLLVACLALQGCASTSVREHRTRGAPESITFKPTWQDATGDKHLVGGVRCEVRKGALVVAQGTTDGEVPLLFEPLEPGRYEVVVAAPGVITARREVVVEPRRRLTVSMDVAATSTEERPASAPGGQAPSTGGPQPSAGDPVGDGVVFVLKVVGTVLLVVTLIGVAALVLSVDDDDCCCSSCDDPCRCATCHGRACDRR